MMLRLIAAEEEDEMEMIAKRGAVFEKAVRKVRYFSADEQQLSLILI